MGQHPVRLQNKIGRNGMGGRRTGEPSVCPCGQAAGKAFLGPCEVGQAPGVTAAGAEAENTGERKAASLYEARCMCAETLRRQQRETFAIQRVRELEVMVGQARRETPDTTTLFLFAGSDFPGYQAGQFLTIDPHQFAELERFTAYLEDAKGQREKPRAYSLASAPHEPDLAITVKAEPYISGKTPYPPLLSPYLAYEAGPGTRFTVRGFTGAYTLTPDDADEIDRVVHLCAGSGIVPSYGIVKESLYRGDAVHHTLLYSSKTRQDIVYYRELEALRQAHPDRFKVIHCVTRETLSGMQGAHNGRISGTLLREVISEPGHVLAFVCGPGVTSYERRAAREGGREPAPRFVEGMISLLLECGLDKKQIRHETWG